MNNPAPELRDNAPAETPRPDRPQAGTGEVPESLTLPDGAIPILPVRNLVLFPGTVLPLEVDQPRSVAAAQFAVKSHGPIGVLLQRDPGAGEPGPGEFYEIGTVAQILRYVASPEGASRLICRGEQRFRVIEFLEGYPFVVARIERIAEPAAVGSEVEARMLKLKERAIEAIKLLPDAPEGLRDAIGGINAPGALADVLASFMDIKPAEKQQILEAIDLVTRLDRVLWFVSYRLEVLRLSRDIGERTRQSIEGRQREHILREQLRTIQRELGEGEEDTGEISELAEAIAKAGMPPEVETHALKELKRLRRIPDSSPEHSMLRSYLEWLAELPWQAGDGEPIDLAEARKVLDEDHYGLEKVKKRILEYLAVRKLNPTGNAPILCFVGPPGVGKTSLGQSIARTMKRKFARVSLGGVHDEAEIRGHRRTYIGAMPGNIIQAIRKVGTRDCVMMLDEIDKLGRGFQGDPSSALLEVLDPAQNSTFRDNYLGVPFDLSKVVFIGTANMLDTIPAPLLDRMEVIRLSGYTESEKVQIAVRYLVPRQLTQNGLTPESCSISEDAIRTIIRKYTREAGVRNLEREIGSVLRNVAMRIAEGSARQVQVAASDIPAILGAPRFEGEQAERLSVPGVATGLAWTPVGGDILFVEASIVPGKGRLTLTGQLGDVMKESAQAALSLVKAKQRELGIDLAVFESNDIHVHVPAGAIPKDGPSAGVTMFVALASGLTRRPVRADVAMTGEISLRGLVLPVGGIKEKVLAAMHSGIKTVMLPARNKPDFEDIPEEARQSLTFIWLETVDQALENALVAEKAAA
ncbi:MAG: ATP-dependent Lon protease [Rhodospirillaceae bacterium]|jgi:ATP-dependent Lon protease|nr:ATP-dependent Lon protease [Rhodospirillaceae bacterium]